MGLIKRKKLRTIFIEYVVSLGVLIILLLVANYALFTSVAIMYPANYTEKIIQHNYEKLKESTTVTTELLTPMSSFGVYSKDGSYLYGNFSSGDIKISWDVYSTGDTSIGLSKYIICIEREKDVLIITYPLSMQFKNDVLREAIPNAELAIALLFLLQLILLIVLWSNRFAKRVNRELNALLVTTKKIQEQNLDFNVSNSSIEEIDMVLKGIDTMKSSLKIALEEQWLLEKQKREQVSALAHDIKTPITIVKGNAELLTETNLSKEQLIYCNYIKESSEQMDEYIQKLLSFTRTELNTNISYENIKVIKVLNSLKRKSEALSEIKKLNILWEINVKEHLHIKGDENEFERAIMNIIKNAFDFSPNHSAITIYGTADHCELTIKVIDQGNGFSSKALRYGKEPFFMGNESRSNTGHHGLGLYIANTIITNYNGELTLSNDENGGGLVTVKVPIIN